VLFYKSFRQSYGIIYTVKSQNLNVANEILFCNRSENYDVEVKNLSWIG
jgi:hypothetical protein